MSRNTPKELLLMLAWVEACDAIAQASTCNRAKYGCVLTKLNLTPVSVGYNGVASGLPNECLRDEPGNCGCLHAEWNAICGLRDVSYDGSLIAFISGEPCEMCANMLARAGVVMVVYVRPAHRSYGGTELLDKLQIPHGHPRDMARHLISAKNAASYINPVEDYLKCNTPVPPSVPLIEHRHCEGCGLDNCGTRCIH